MERRMDASDGLVVLGVVMLGAGLGGYDWRLALVVLGVVVLVLGLVGALRNG